MTFFGQTCGAAQVTAGTGAAARSFRTACSSPSYSDGARNSLSRRGLVPLPRGRAVHLRAYLVLDQGRRGVRAPRAQRCQQVHAPRVSHGLSGADAEVIDEEGMSALYGLPVHIGQIGTRTVCVGGDIA